MKKLAIFLLFLYFVTMLLKSIVIKEIEYEPNIDVLLQNDLNATILNDKIKKALNNDSLEEAKGFLDLADSLNIKIDPTLKNELENKNYYLYGAKEFVRGFFKGEVDSDIAFYSNIASDLTLVGDIRDIGIEGKKYINNEPYDEFILGISLVGVGLSLSSISTAGASLGAKTSSSFLKAAAKSNKLTKGFKSLLISRFSKVVDKQALKKVDFLNPKELKAFSKNISLKPVKGIFKQLNKLQKNTSYSDALYLLKFIENEKELKKIAKISQKYKKNTKSIFKIFGKSLLRATKKIVIYTKDFFWYLFGAFFSFFYLIWLFFKR